MLTTTEFMSQCTAPNLAEPLPRPLASLNSAKLRSSPTTAAMRRAFWSSSCHGRLWSLHTARVVVWRGTPTLLYEAGLPVLMSR